MTIAGVMVVPHWKEEEPAVYGAMVVLNGLFTTVPSAVAVGPSANCRFKEPTPKTELAAETATLTPVTVASTGTARTPCEAIRGSCDCPAVSIILATAAPVAVMLVGLLQTAAPPIGKLPAWVGTCGATTVAPDSTVA